MTDHPEYLRSPALFLVPERHAYLILDPGHSAAVTWARDFGHACDEAATVRGLVVAVPILADYTWRPDAEPVPPVRPLTWIDDTPPPAAPDTPSGSGDDDSEVGGFSVGGRDNATAAGYEYRRTPDAHWPGADEIPRDPELDALRWAMPGPPPEVLAEAYAARGVLVHPEAIEAMREGPRDGVTLALLERIRDGLLQQDTPAEAPSAPVAPEDEATVQIDRTPFLRAV